MLITLHVLYEYIRIPDFSKYELCYKYGVYTIPHFQIANY